MDEFLETYNIPRLNYEETENLSKPIANETELVIKNLPVKKNSGPEAFTVEF